MEPDTGERSQTAESLANRIRSRTARAGVVGLGYVGLPLAVEFARAGFPVIGIDTDASKVAEVNAGRSYVGDVPAETLARLVSEGKIRATTELAAIAELDTVKPARRSASICTRAC